MFAQIRNSPAFFRRDPADLPPPRLPATIERRGHAVLRVVLPVVLLMPIWIIAVFAVVPGDDGGPLLLGLWRETPEIFIALGLALVLDAVLIGWLFAGVFRHSRYSVDRIMVACDSRSPFGRDSWRESLGAYQAVALRSIRQKGGTLYVVEMAHPDPARRVPLYINEKQEPALRQQGYWALALKLPSAAAPCSSR